MNSRHLDLARWVLAVCLVFGAVIGNFYFSNLPFLYRLIGVVICCSLALFTASFTDQGKSFIGFAKEARAEVRRVTWPSKQETWATAGVVFVVVLLSSFILWLIDLALGAFVAFIIE